MYVFFSCVGASVSLGKVHGSFARLMRLGNLRFMAVTSVHDVASVYRKKLYADRREEGTMIKLCKMEFALAGNIDNVFF